MVIYLFTERKQIVEAFEQQTSSGALVINDTIVQNSSALRMLLDS